MIVRQYGLLLLLLLSTAVMAAEDNFAFEDPSQRAAFLRLTEELRCPMCQNQNIADSDAMIAHDMRRKIYSLLQQGQSEEQIIDYMKARYGDFVHYQPPVNAATLWLWALPVIFAGVAVMVIVRRRRPELPEDMAAKLAKADEMLKREQE
ncbi:cytochrome c-type biogenesis protein CcmH [Alteromonas sp. ASW11-19]|uniref:Cytochrome c-type biogenesis protein n=1 Tax=Alteromonas salexigens TaxID=2982530 RepID=A0ABT2VRP1_9ALTE|nr:cytochrome c-type biogenesis protein [Alteromonas salexigens]MCU7554891.1 cytochrome c-type biogenesis protein CcmH [Alteromonas salexigens]